MRVRGPKAPTGRREPKKAAEGSGPALVRFGRDVAHGFEANAVETAVGLKDAAVGLWKMTGGAVIDRREAARLWKQLLEIARAIVRHPALLPKAIVQPYVKAWKAGHPGDAVGRAAFDIASSLAIGGAMSQLSSALSAASPALNFVANTADDVARVAARLSLAVEDLGGGKP
jgi:hypothetical protein